MERGRARTNSDADSLSDLIEEMERTIAENESVLQMFSLSGGVMKSGARTSNRIDGLLTRMMEHPSADRYMANIDTNLDCLYTSLKLDMIDLIADDISRAQKIELGRAKEQETAPLGNIQERLERVRSALENRSR